MTSAKIGDLRPDLADNGLREVNYMKTKTKLTDAEWEHLVRELVKTVAQQATRNRGAAASVARSTNLSKSAIAQMKRSGKAGIVSFIRVAIHLAGINDQDAKGLIQNPASILSNLEPSSEIDSLFREIRGYYSDNELAAWLKLLRSKHQVEENLGVTVKASLRKRKSK